MGVLKPMAWGVTRRVHGGAARIPLACGVTLAHMGRILIILAIVMLTIYCVVEVAQSQPGRIRAMPKWLWAFVVIAIPVIGPVTWLLAGRPQASQGHRRSLGPDDDEDFLRGLR